jgi:hypothetical protein
MSMKDLLQYLVSQLPDESLTPLLETIHNELAARRDVRNAALPEYVWLTGRQPGRGVPHGLSNFGVAVQQSGSGDKAILVRPLGRQSS